MYGNCVECGFPVLVKDANPVACPFCATIQKPISLPISDIPTSSIITAVLIIGGLFVLAKSR